MARFQRIASLKTADKFRAYAAARGLKLPLAEPGADGPMALAEPYALPTGFVVGNRFCAQPMEGWDGTPDGKPTELTRRRWRNFGRSGAKLIWGGEAVAVTHEGRANPHQLCIREENLTALRELREELVVAHRERFGTTANLLVGLQLTHSGRFSCPNEDGRREPRILYHHPLLDRRVGAESDDALLSDADIERLIGRFVDAAAMAHEIGFDFVDVKHCHGYLGHEFLSAVTRPGPYGGSFENRTRFLRRVVEGIRDRVPGLWVGVRVSVFDTPPFEPGPDGMGVPETFSTPYVHAFGADPDDPLRPDPEEPLKLLQLLEMLEVGLVNVTVGSPYYNPHIQRPALYPPSDGYAPPEDPLMGVARQMRLTAELRRGFPGLAIVGSAYTYLQEWLPAVAEGAVTEGWTDFVGLGRALLSYPEMPADILGGEGLKKNRVCRTFSLCTTAPRKGLVSGCYPLDPFYRSRPEADGLGPPRKEPD